MRRTSTENLRKALSIVLCFALVMAYVPMMSLSAFATEGISYIDANGNEKVYTGEYTEITAESKILESGWYIVNKNITMEVPADYSSNLIVSGDVHLILCDGSTLTLNSKFEVGTENSLTIYGQTNSTGTLNANKGIGAVRTGTIIINGGIINATGPSGPMNSTGGTGSAGIGAVYKATYNSSTVQDYGYAGTIVINGGTVTATGGGGAAGIGMSAASRYTSGATVTINGGTVVAIGSDSGAGIGGGTYNGAMTITITGGTVSAQGGKNSPGIGCGSSGDACSVIISGGNIKAFSTSNKLTIGNGTWAEGKPTLKNADGENISLKTLDFGTEQVALTKINGLPGYYDITGTESIDGKYYIYVTSNVELGNAYAGAILYELTENGYVHNHDFINGFCVCGEYVPATETNDKYDVNGDGYTDQVYEIANAGQLYWFAGLVNGTLTDVQKNKRANAVLTADIVVNKNVLNDDYSLNGDGSNFRVWTPIGNNWGARFAGIIDGKGHTISGLYINDESIEDVGLVGYLEGSVRNIGVEDTYFFADRDVGAICGWSGDRAKIENCYAKASLGDTWNCVGGFVGSSVMSDGRIVTIKNSYFSGTISEGKSFEATGRAKVINCYYNSDLCSDKSQGIGKTTEQFASGEVTYLLNSSSPDGVWKQTVGEDAYPNFTGEKVYYGYSCKTQEYVGYANEKAHPTQSHYDENGYCSICKTYQPAELNADGYHEIYNVGQLYWFAEEVNSFNNSTDAVYNAILMNDIVINENLVDEDGKLSEDTASLRQWMPISSGTHTFYNGVFNGNYHTISGVYIDNPNLSYSALFGKLQNGVIKNLGVTDSYINGERSSAFAALSTGLIENCFVTDTIIKGQYADSFVVGYSGTQDDYDYPCMVRKTYSTATVYENGTQVQAAFLSDRISENSYYLHTSDNGAGGKTAEQFTSGEVAYLLGSPWGQELEKDLLPVWNGKTVYLGYDCGGTDAYYSNTELLGENDNNHIHGDWTSSDTYGVHKRYICIREGCPQYMVIETENCYGGTATCEDIAICSACHYFHGDYDYENHTSNKTYVTQGDENGHQLFHECCDILISTTPHSFEGYGFDTHHHWNACDCGYVNETVKESHTFDGNGFCTVCGGYESANVIFDEEYYSFVAEIENAGQFFWYAKNYSEGTIDGDGDGYGDNVGGVLVADIDLNPGYTFNEDGSYSVDETAENYSPVLREWKPIQGFQWVDFDGQNHTVKGLYINTPDENNVGLFATNDYYTIKNIKLVNGFVYGGSDTAALVGYNTGSILNCHSDVSVKGSGTIGGIVGYHYGSEISNCSNSGSVIIYGASSSTGGIAGTANGNINNCFNTGYIKGGICVGGIAGNNNSLVSNCYNTGLIISSFADAHGISGYGTIENCYTLGAEDNGTYRKTKAQFESGEIAYLLQSAQPINDIYDEETWEIIGTEQAAVWFQTIGTDLAPTLDNTSLVIYKNLIGGCCEENYVYSYSNTEKEPVITHLYDNNGFCVCGEYEPAVYNEINDAYEIANAGQLYWFAEKVNSGEYTINGSLVADITVNEAVFNKDGNLIENTNELREWVPIGSSENAYNGIFDGNGKIISGLYANMGNIGLISQVGESGIVRNVGIVASMIKGSSQVGGIAGVNNGIIEGCYFSGKVVATNQSAGGIVGENNGSVTNCYSLAYVQGANMVGGLVGYNKQSSVSNCFHSGAIVGNNYVGALVGTATYSSVTNCYYNSTKALVTLEAIGRNNNSTILNAEAKSAEQFASGEVVYLLQQGNTEQVWGQDNNQPGATPILDKTGLYKVVTVSEAGNYSVSNIGDIDNDGAIDAIDYQTLVNKALAGDHEQIETASYNDIIKYDLDGNGYLNVIDASYMERLLNGHVAVEVFAVGDYDMNGVAFEEADVLAMTQAMKNPEKMTTQQKYICDLNADGIINEEDLVILNK